MGSALELVGRPSLGEVRRWAVAVLPPLDEDLADDVLLVVNELVANAYDHTDAPVRLRMFADDVRVHVEVEDGSVVPPAPRRSHPVGTRGRGLLLVEKLASSWGSTPGPTGKTVWAHLDRAPAAPMSRA